MPSVTIAPVTVPNWQLGSDVQLRIYALQAFVASDGSLIEPGQPTEDSAQSGNWFQAATCTVSGTGLSVPSISLHSTTDSEDNPAATYGAYFYTTEGQRICPFGQFTSFPLPASPTSTSWAAIARALTGNL